MKPRNMELAQELERVGRLAQQAGEAAIGETLLILALEVAVGTRTGERIVIEIVMPGGRRVVAGNALKGAS